MEDQRRNTYHWLTISLDAILYCEKVANISMKLPKLPSGHQRLFSIVLESCSGTKFGLELPLSRFTTLAADGISVITSRIEVRAKVVSTVIIFILPR